MYGPETSVFVPLAGQVIAKMACNGRRLETALYGFHRLVPSPPQPTRERMDRRNIWFDFKETPKGRQSWASSGR